MTTRPRRRTSTDNQLGGRPRQRVVAYVRATQPHCHLCRYVIDLSLDRHRHPLASCVDELIPRKYGGSALDYSNVAHAHRLCNGMRGVKPITPELRQRCRNAVDRYLGRMEAHHEW